MVGVPACESAYVHVSCLDSRSSLFSLPFLVLASSDRERAQTFSEASKNRPKIESCSKTKNKTQIVTKWASVRIVDSPARAHKHTDSTQTAHRQHTDHTHITRTQTHTLASTHAPTHTPHTQPFHILETHNAHFMHSMSRDYIALLPLSLASPEAPIYRVISYLSCMMHPQILYTIWYCIDLN